MPGAEVEEGKTFLLIYFGTPRVDAEAPEKRYDYTLQYQTRSIFSDFYKAPVSTAEAWKLVVTKSALFYIFLLPQKKEPNHKIFIVG